MAGSPCPRAGGRGGAPRDVVMGGKGQWRWRWTWGRVALVPCVEHGVLKDHGGGWQGRQGKALQGCQGRAG